MARSAAKFAPISFTHVAGAATTVVSPVASRRILVLAVLVIIDATANVNLEDTDGTLLTGPAPVDIYSGFLLPGSEQGWACTALNKGVRVKTSAAATGGGVLVYQEMS